MSSQPFLNLLLAFRKRSALSQGDVAFLLGAQDGAKVCRYERFSREPGLHTAFAYEAIFGRPLSELFPGLYSQIQEAVQERAKILEKRGIRGNSKSLTARKRQSIAAIASRKFNNPRL